jgi:hypothetical protein
MGLVAAKRREQKENEERLRPVVGSDVGKCWGWEQPEESLKARGSRKKEREGDWDEEKRVMRAKRERLLIQDRRLAGELRNLGL